MKDINWVDMISKNFNRSEFACKCGCGFDWADIAYTVAIPLILLGGSL